MIGRSRSTGAVAVEEPGVRSDGSVAQCLGVNLGTPGEKASDCGIGGAGQEENNDEETSRRFCFIRQTPRLCMASTKFLREEKEDVREGEEQCTRRRVQRRRVEERRGGKGGIKTSRALRRRKELGRTFREMDIEIDIGNRYRRYMEMEMEMKMEMEMEMEMEIDGKGARAKENVEPCLSSSFASS
eukprot:752288-Hanusia_phi.AAC.2